MTQKNLERDLVQKLSAFELSETELPKRQDTWASFLDEVSQDYRWRNETLRTACDGIFRVDASGKILYSSGEVFGYPREKLVGESIFQFIDVRGYRLKDAIERAFSEHLSEAHDVVYRSASGDLVHFSHRVSPVYRDGQVIAAVIVATDISEQKEMEKLAKASQALIQEGGKMISLGKMAGGLAHEVNTPLTTILLSMEQIKNFLAERHLNDPVVHEQLASLTSNVGRISNLVGALRNLAIDDAGEPIALTSVERIIENTVALCREKFRNEGIALQVSLFPSTLHCRARPVQVSQSLACLLDNAWEAARSSVEKWVKVEAQVAANGSVEIAVSDSGDGVSPMIRDQIFQPFFTTKEARSGIGMGLAISRKLIENLGGRLSLDETAPHTRFVIQLLPA